MRAAQITVPTPLGSLVVSELGGRIVATDWGEAVAETETPVLAAAAQQLNASTEEISSSASHLAGAAERLTGSVGGFRFQ